MIKRIHQAAQEWLELRQVLRRWPWLDYVLSAALILWGIEALYDWKSVVTRSHFYSFWFIIHFMGAGTITIGLWQAVSSYRRSGKSRQTASFFGLWALLSLAWNVEAMTGHIAWGALAFLEFLVCCALVVL